MKLSTITSALALSVVAAASSSHSPASKHIIYTTVTGYFLQDEASTDPSTFDYTSHNFGLIPRHYNTDKPHNEALSQWERFHRQLVYLNQHSPKHISYKLFFLGRHGEGYHNAAESYFGTPAWNCYWSLLNGNSTTTWADADLTASGIEQAQIAHAFWLQQYQSQNIHFPDAYYSSPMTRALRTANITFTGLPTSAAGTADFLPLVKEGFREGTSLHTCDRRRTKSYIQDLFPTWKIEKGFTEDDELWTGVKGETPDAQDERSRRALDSIFFNKASAPPHPPPPGSSVAPEQPKDKEDLVVSVTSHSGEIASILRVIGHRQFKLSTGAVIPVLVRAEEIEKTGPTTSATWTVSAHCTEPPVTSVTGCVCASSAAPVTTGVVEFGF